MTPTPPEPAEREFVVARTFDAPREAVFRAWTDPAQLARWWAPKGFEAVTMTLDLRPGGLFHYGLKAPDGRVEWGRFVFREIAAHGLLVFASAYSDESGGAARRPRNPSWPLEILDTATFEEQGRRTKLTLRGVAIDAGPAERKAFEAGIESLQKDFAEALGRLDAHLARGRKGGSEAAGAAGRRPGLELSVTRVIAAPRGRVFTAWAEPERLARWLGPAGFTLLSCEMDFRPGGAYRFGLRGPDGKEYPVRGTYREIAAPERLVWSEDSPDGGPEIARTTVTFDEQDGRTRLTVRQVFAEVTAETEPRAAGAERGWSETLERLAAYAENG